MIIIGKDGNIEHWEPNPRKAVTPDDSGQFFRRENEQVGYTWSANINLGNAPMPQFELVNPRVEVPERLLPFVGWLPEGCLVAIINTSDIHYHSIAERYQEELRAAFPEARFTDFPRAHTVSTGLERIQELWEARVAAVRDRVIHFVFYTGQANRFIDQQVDYMFYLRTGYVGLLIDLGKARRPEPIERKHAMVYG